jgi:hypothetical protein
MTENDRVGAARRRLFASCAERCGGGTCDAAAERLWRKKAGAKAALAAALAPGGLLRAIALFLRFGRGRKLRADLQGDAGCQVVILAKQLAFAVVVRPFPATIAAAIPVVDMY